MPRLERGEHTRLNVTQKAQHRVFAGLGWEPNARARLTDRLGELIGVRKSWHDLDLACLMFNQDKKPLGDVSVRHHSDQSGLIYHSGDNVAGFGEGDDEQISVELLKLDPSIHYIMFLASIKSGHCFGDIDSPEIRLADGYSNHNFLNMPLNQAEGRCKAAFAFASIYRTPDNGWNLHNISTYLDLQAVLKPNGALSSLLTKA